MEFCPKLHPCIPATPMTRKNKRSHVERRYKRRMKAIARKVVANLVNRKAGTKTANYNTSTNDLYEMLRTTAPDVFQRFDTGYTRWISPER